MNKKNKIFGVIVAVGVVIAGFFIVHHLRWVTTDNAQLQAHSVMIAPKVPGFITKVLVEEGQHVKRGDLLAEIDSRDYENALAIAKGQLGSAEAVVQESQKNYKRLSDLYKSGAISQQQFDSATKTYTDSKAKAEAVIARVEQANLNLEYTKIIAPSDGFIAKKSVEPGQLAAPGIPLFGFVDSGERWVLANFKETEIAKIKKGAHVEVDVDAVPGTTFEGEVLSLSAATGATFTLLPPDNATGNFTKVVQHVPVKIILNNLKPEDIEKLRAGLSVVVRVRRE